MRIDSSFAQEQVVDEEPVVEETTRAYTTKIRKGEKAT